MTQIYAVAGDEVRKVERTRAAVGTIQGVRWCPFCDRSSQTTYPACPNEACGARFVDQAYAESALREAGLPPAEALVSEVATENAATSVDVSLEEPPLPDLATLTVAKLQPLLAALTLDGMLALLESEKAGPNRVTAITAIERAIEAERG